MSKPMESARQAVIQTLPLFEMARMRTSNAARRHPTEGFAGDSPSSTWRWVNQFTHTRRLLGPEDKEVVTPNNDTLYTNAWLDLSDGPVVIDVPEIEKQLQHNKASLERSIARVSEMEARVVSARADHEAAKATVEQADAAHKSASAWVRFRGKRIDMAAHQHRFRPWEFE